MRAHGRFRQSRGVGGTFSETAKHNALAHAQGVAMGSKLYGRFSSQAEATQFVSSIVANANLVYRPQMNMVLSVSRLVLQTTPSGAPSWNQGACLLLRCTSMVAIIS